MLVLVACTVSCAICALGGSAVPCLGVLIAYIVHFVLSAPSSGGVCYLMCCALGVMTMIYMLRSMPSTFPRGIGWFYAVLHLLRAID